MGARERLAVGIVSALQGSHLEAFDALVDAAVELDPAGVIQDIATLSVAMADAFSAVAGSDASISLERLASDPRLARSTHR